MEHIQTKIQKLGSRILHSLIEIMSRYVVTYILNVLWTDKRQYMWIVVILGILSIGLIKLSVLLLYRRLFNVSRIFNIYSAVLIVLTVLWTIGFLAANIFQCGTYPAAAWTSGKMLLKYCDDISTATTSRAITNVVMDLLIVVSPMPIIWQMRMSLTQKLQVTAIFALGFL